MKVKSCQYPEVIINKELEWIADIVQQYGKLIKFSGIFHELRTNLSEQDLNLILPQYIPTFHNRLRWMAILAVHILINYLNWATDCFINCKSDSYQCTTRKCMPNITCCPFQSFTWNSCLLWYMSICLIQNFCQLYVLKWTILKLITRYITTTIETVKKYIFTTMVLYSMIMTRDLKQLLCGITCLHCWVFSSESHNPA